VEVVIFYRPHFRF